MYSLLFLIETLNVSEKELLEIYMEATLVCYCFHLLYILIKIFAFVHFEFDHILFLIFQIGIAQQKYNASHVCNSEFPSIHIKE